MTINTQYEDLLHKVLEYGVTKTDRTGTGTRSLFAEKMTFDLSEGHFPLITTKKVHFKSIVVELLWFLRGDTNVKYLHDNGVTIWDEWADVDGSLGPVYGKQWRSWGRHGSDTGFDDIDQIAQVIESIKTNPDSRRHIVSAWNVSDVDDMALPPCHLMFQFYVHAGRLDLQMYQRSADMFLGVPFNIASYALLLRMIAAETGLRPGVFTWVGGDVHIYENHIPQVEQQLDRIPREFPGLWMASGIELNNYTPDDFKLVGYDPYPAISGKVAV